MAASATLLSPAVSSTPRPVAKTGFSFGDFIDLLAKSLLMAQALPDTGRPTARQVQRVRRLVETI